MKVFSMFDGVGGFVIGLQKADKELFDVTYANQFEPGRKSQDAHEIGVYRFPDIEHIPTDVALIPDEKFEEMKANGVDMIVGGFPCQDYSVARSKKNEMGIEGKKGVLFWEIIRAVSVIKPKYLILENVDRLLKAPSSQRGRDFAIMLAAFNQLNYSVEWRVINAADYGRAQRRRRVFIFVYRNDTPWAKKQDSLYESVEEKTFDTYRDYIFSTGLFARGFPVKNAPNKNRVRDNQLEPDIVTLSKEYNDGLLWNAGIMRHGHYYTADTLPLGDEQPITLGDILVPEESVDEKYYLGEEAIAKFKYLRGPKRLTRKNAEGFEYTYAEGGMSEFDDLSLPARTMLTSEGSINRSTHFLNINGKYRLLTPVEAERLQDFPDDWTRYKKKEDGSIQEVTDRLRLFFMGNALVTGIVTRIANELKDIIQEV